eukprot:102275-Amphidinium_carterae.1
MTPRACTSTHTPSFAEAHRASLHAAACRSWKSAMERSRMQKLRRGVHWVRSTRYLWRKATGYMVSCRKGYHVRNVWSEFVFRNEAGMLLLSALVDNASCNTVSLTHVFPLPDPQTELTMSPDYRARFPF